MAAVEAVPTAEYGTVHQDCDGRTILCCHRLTLSRRAATRPSMTNRPALALPLPAVIAPASRLQLATQMHQMLLRELGHGIEVERLLMRERYARDVLLVCDAMAGTDLPRLSSEFRRAIPEPKGSGTAEPKGSVSLALEPKRSPTVITAMKGSVPVAASHPPGHMPRANAWSADTSGFGVSRPPPDERRANPPEPAMPKAKGSTVAPVLGAVRRWLPRMPWV